MKSFAVVTLVLSAIAATNAANYTAAPAVSCDRACPMNFMPVCGSDGVTYSNKCALEAAACAKPSITFKSEGACATKAPVTCAKACTKEYAPVCGSNGVTYSNKCEFSVAKCDVLALQLKSEGPCKTQAPAKSCAKMCTKEYAPVCGSDAVTYSNKCEFSIAKCEKPALKLKSEGPCKVIEPRTKAPVTCAKACTKEFDPVCGSDAVTYSNKCEFSVAKCEKPALKLKSEGPCKTKKPAKSCAKACTKEFAPVCGSDGVTYSNKCMFSIAKCEKPALKLTCETACPTKAPITLPTVGPI